MSVSRPIKIGIVAGEASGDALGASLIAALHRQLPEAKFVGLAGNKMQALGAQSWYPMERLAVRGLVEVLRHIPELYRLRQALYQRMLDEEIDLFIGIDSPDFNLGLERKLKKDDVRTIHFVSPSIWAWRRGRIKKIKRAVHRVLALFPFELSFYQQAGVPVTYVGHPAAQHAADASSRKKARQILGIDDDTPVFALLPGSRYSEVEEHTELLTNAARRIRHNVPNAQFLVPLVSKEIRKLFETLYRKIPNAVPLTLLDGCAEEVLRAADIGLVASGTATLEAMLARCPHVIFYRASPVSVWIVRRLIQVPWVGLPNVLAQRFVVPELIQEEATSQKLADSALLMYRDDAQRTEIEQTFAELVAALRTDTGALAAQAVLEELGNL